MDLFFERAVYTNLPNPHGYRPTFYTFLYTTFEHNVALNILKANVTNKHLALYLIIRMHAFCRGMYDIIQVAEVYQCRNWVSTDI